MTAWHWFGDPERPRRNLVGGLVLAILGAVQLGMSLAWGPGADALWSWYLAIGLALAMVGCGVAQFILGLRHTRADERVT